MSETTEKADSKPDDVEPVAATEAAEPKKVAGGLVGGIIKTARPRQWVKNVLVFAAPLA
ncbi:MAG TPA: decaprenyl-phosphate phosphoribosyltransferase, partial [Amycolatopsis sp.]|nr:decaprenyl-phosphate phosphoribosyltransferase [Amycolatopsis sp.]